MKILKFTLFIAFCVCSFNTSFGQDRFLKAHIIDNNQQRIDGSIDFGSPIRNPDKIIFLDSSTLRISIYEPLDIQSFVVETSYERRYESKIVHFTDYPKYIEDLDDSGIPEIITDTVFVEVLVKGKASLYQYKDEEKWEHFFAEKDGEFQTLMQTLTRYDMLNKDVIKLTERYKSQLRKLFADCPSIIERISALENTESSLQEIFTDYNICSGDDNAFLKDRKSSRKRAGYLAINLGYRNSRLFLSDVKLDDKSYLENMSFSRSAGLPIGLSLDIPLSTKNNRLSLYNELLFVRFVSFSELRETTEKTEKFGFLYRYTRYSAALRYNFGKEAAKISPFINIGGNLSYAITSSSNIATNYSFTFPNTLYHTFLVNPRRFPIGAIAGFGTKINRFSGEFRMEYTNGLSLNYAMKTSILSAYLMFTYSLGK
jgi:hypothetical protein